MTIKVVPNKIPVIWEAVKYAAVKADSVREKDIPAYLNNLLRALLSSKAQCFVRLDEDKKLIRMCITRIGVDEVTGEKSLALSTTFGFKPSEPNAWVEDIDFVKSFARKNNCSRLLVCSNNKRIFEIMNELGFEESFRHFVLEV